MVIKSLAQKHGENVADVDAWREEYDCGTEPEKAFYTEYPEHKPEQLSAAEIYDDLSE